MKITIKKTGSGKGRYQCYSYVEPKKTCCDEMKEALDENVIKFGEYDSILNSNNSLNIFKCYPYPEGPCWDEYEINFCPFCGEKIKYVGKDD